MKSLFRTITRSVIRIIRALLIIGISITILVLVYLAFWYHNPRKVRSFLVEEFKYQPEVVENIPKIKVPRFRFSWKLDSLTTEWTMTFKQPIDSSNIKVWETLCKEEDFKSLSGWMYDADKDTYIYWFHNIGGANCTDSVFFYPSKQKARFKEVSYSRGW